MATTSCLTCRFWRKITESDEEHADGNQGECRINPPVIVGALSLQEQRKVAHEIDAPLYDDYDKEVDMDEWLVCKGRFPRTDDDAWCGQWEADDLTTTNPKPYDSP